MPYVDVPVFSLLVHHSHNSSVTNDVLHDVRAVESTTNIYVTLAVKSFQKNNGVY